MMSPDDRALEDLLYSGHLGDEAEGAERGGGPQGLQGSAAAENVSVTALRSEVNKWLLQMFKLILTALRTAGQLKFCTVRK